MKQLNHILSIAILVICLCIPLGLAIAWSVTGNTKLLLYAGFAMLFFIIAYKPLTEWRIRARDLAQTDEFGNSKRKTYARLSQKERDAIDLQKTADAERLVGSVALKRLTKKGSTNPQEDLDKLIGLASVKQKVAEMAAKMEFDKQEKKRKGKNFVSQFDSGHHAVYFGSPGTGKAQPLYSKVLTPNGFKCMGDIKQGDVVVSGTGKLATVLGVFPQGKKPIYELKLEDDSVFRCSDEHICHVSLNGAEPINIMLKEILRLSVDVFVNVPKFQDGKKVWYRLTKITYIRDEECQCIYIDDDSHLYITDDYIITHNTTIARIMTGFLYKYGYIKNNKCVEVDGNFLKAGSETATKTTMIIRQAFGGVLFIDEAYALVQGDQYGHDAIATLIKQMEDNRDRFVLILAGYTNEMRDLLESNPGFQSRLKEYLYFDDYNDNDMCTIFKMMAEEKGYKLTYDAEQNLLARIQNERPLPSFGNARTARSILDEAMEKHAYNFIAHKLPEDQRYIISADDLSVTPHVI